jgi:hypothetical protein
VVVRTTCPADFSEILIVPKVATKEVLKIKVAFNLISIFNLHYESSTQWAAVKTQFGRINEAPHTQVLSIFKCACHGNCPNVASDPPTINGEMLSESETFPAPLADGQVLDLKSVEFVLVTLIYVCCITLWLNRFDNFFPFNVIVLFAHLRQGSHTRIQLWADFSTTN